MTPVDLARRADLTNAIEYLRMVERSLADTRTPSLLNRIRAIKGEVERELDVSRRVRGAK